MGATMWQQLEAERWRREWVDEGRLSGTVLFPDGDPEGGGATDATDATDDNSVPVTLRRWEHSDGRCAVHVSDADPELLVLDRATGLLTEYDLPGTRTAPDASDPLKGGRPVRTVRAVRAEDDARHVDPWVLLRGWS